LHNSVLEIFAIEIHEVKYAYYKNIFYACFNCFDHLQNNDGIVIYHQISLFMGSTLSYTIKCGLWAFVYVGVIVNLRFAEPSLKAW